MSKYYKVVSVGDFGRMYSAVASGFGFNVEYLKDHWTKPYLPKSKLMVFSDLKSAKEFFESLKNCIYKYQIWECEVKNPSELEFILHGSFVCSVFGSLDDEEREALSRFWETGERIRFFGTFVSPPEGTIAVDEVKLIKLIE